MFKKVFANRLFIGVLVIFIFCVGGSLLYMQHVKESEAVKLAETEEHVKQWNARRDQEPPAEGPVVEQSAQAGHSHEDGAGA